ncbi:hypothetical protein [Nocardia sp. alder85J]|uniref:hypothetical protein n=1 Tax=Nocardia sp. alder85J TaxID=2862949 RepID=UPI001CD780AE|nr:hypothetical protein [Nocardia sp. alder85J]MCX4097604.1 hypothetical protein [Nocardia sp. alder85J]
MTVHHADQLWIDIAIAAAVLLPSAVAVRMILAGRRRRTRTTEYLRRPTESEQPGSWDMMGDDEDAER